VAEKAKFTRWDDMPVEKMNADIGRQYVVGTGTMLARIFLRAGGVVPRHSHANEQITYVLEGALRFRLWDDPADLNGPGREVLVRAGEVLCIPPDVPHEALAVEDTVDLDVFNPPRRDWIEGTDGYLRGGGSSPTG
jgi:quercetin dioxygenase-like cupin family protein